MTALHPHQSRASSPRRRLAGVILLPASAGRHQLAVDRDPIATRPFSFPRKFACQGQFTRIYRKLLQYICQDRPEGLHCHTAFLSTPSTDGSKPIGKAFAKCAKIHFVRIKN